MVHFFFAQELVKQAAEPGGFASWLSDPNRLDKRLGRSLTSRLGKTLMVAGLIGAPAYVGYRLATAPRMPSPSEVSSARNRTVMQQGVPSARFR